MTFLLLQGNAYRQPRRDVGGPDRSRPGDRPSRPRQVPPTCEGPAGRAIPMPGLSGESRRRRPGRRGPGFARSSPPPGPSPASDLDGLSAGACGCSRGPSHGRTVGRSRPGRSAAMPRRNARRPMKTTRRRLAAGCSCCWPSAAGGRRARRAAGRRAWSGGAGRGGDGVFQVKPYLQLGDAPAPGGLEPSPCSGRRPTATPPRLVGRGPRPRPGAPGSRPGRRRCGGSPSTGSRRSGSTGRC